MDARPDYRESDERHFEDLWMGDLYYHLRKEIESSVLWNTLAADFRAGSDPAEVAHYWREVMQRETTARLQAQTVCVICGEPAVGSVRDPYGKVQHFCESDHPENQEPRE